VVRGKPLQARKGGREVDFVANRVPTVEGSPATGTSPLQNSELDLVLGKGILATRCAPRFAFLQDVSDAPLQEVEIEATSIADDLSESFVDGGKVLADISQQFLLLTRTRNFLRFSY
jgi:hypothetical protein